MCHVKKLHRIKKSIFGFAGNAVLGIAMLEWLAGPRNKAQLYKTIPESMRDEIDVLELSHDGLAYWNGWGVRMPLLDATFAIGSGAMAALSAVRADCTPAQAVLRVFSMDECSGLISEPEVEALTPPTTRKRR